MNKETEIAFQQAELSLAGPAGAREADILQQDRGVQIGIRIQQYEESLKAALQATKKLAELGVSHPWVKRTDTTSQSPRALGMRSVLVGQGAGTGMRSGTATTEHVDETLIQGTRLRLEVR